MGETTKIAWTDHTFNPWIGCQKVSPGCANCYAEAQANRWKWGVFGDQPRRRTSDANWDKVIRWNESARVAGVRRRVFCASLSDVFEDNREVRRWRHELWTLISICTGLDWLLLTKRPERIAESCPVLDQEHVHFGTTVETQAMADQRIPVLLGLKCAGRRFLSCEPLLERVDLRLACIDIAPGYKDGFLHRHDMPHPCDYSCGGKEIEGGIDWVIVGGESGPKARPCPEESIRFVVDQCRETSVPVFVKQMGARWAQDVRADLGVGTGRGAGADPAEWPEDLRVRQFPEAARG